MRRLLPATENLPVDAEEPRGSEHILFVENDENVREVVTDMLIELGYHVVATADGKEALERLASDAPIDLLFTDHILPNGINGRDWPASRAYAARDRKSCCAPATAVARATKNFPSLPNPTGGASFPRTIRAVLDGAPA